MLARESLTNILENYAQVVEIKDEKSQLSSVMFKFKNARLRFAPENGMKIVAWGRIGVYAPAGKYQLYVERMRPVGLGDLADQVRRTHPEPATSPAGEQPTITATELADDFQRRRSAPSLLLLRHHRGLSVVFDVEFGVDRWVRSLDQLENYRQNLPMKSWKPSTPSCGGASSPPGSPST